MKAIEKRVTKTISPIGGVDFSLRLARGGYIFLHYYA